MDSKQLRISPDRKQNILNYLTSKIDEFNEIEDDGVIHSVDIKLSFTSYPFEYTVVCVEENTNASKSL